MAVGKGFGLGDVECSPTDAPLLKRTDQRVGVDVAAPGDVHQPRMGSHRSQFPGAEDAVGFGGEGEGEHDEVGAGEDVEQVFGADHGDDAGH